MTRFADRVRGRPIRGFAPDGDGTRVRVRLNEDALVQAVSSGYYHPALWRDLPAAIVAARNGDAKPILRLAAETVTIDAPTTDPPASSEALYLAVICHDYPQLWAPATRLADRPSEARSRLAAYPPGTFTPSRRRPGRARTMRACWRVCAGPRRRVRTRPTRPARSTQRCRRSS